MAAPAAAHLLTRGTPLSQLAVSSPLAVAGRVQAVSEAGGRYTVTLAVETPVLGKAPAGPLRFAVEGHHTPRYAAGDAILAFLANDAPPFASRQTALDRVDLPDTAAERRALFAAVRALAGLRNAPDRDARIERLKVLALAHLDSPSERVRHEALLDLVAVSGAARFAVPDVARIEARAKRPDVQIHQAAGLVVLLAAIRLPEAEAALLSLMRQAPSAQVRARATHVIGRRGVDVPALRLALRDPALEVRLTAEQALAALSPTDSEPTASNPRKGNRDVEPHPTAPR